MIKLNLHFFLIVITLLTLSKTNAQSCLKNDSLELVKIYQACNGSSWRTSWNLEDPISTWYGIWLTADGCNVKTIQLINNNVSHTLPPVKLDKLKTLILRGNNLTSVSDKVELPAIERINLSDNKINYLATWDRFPNLITLELNDNLLEAVPDFSLPKLSTLNLRENILENIPDFENLNNLIILYLDHNELTSVPSLRTTNLMYLSLNNNYLTSVSDFSNLTKLSRLYLENNLLASLPDFSNFNVLDVRNNKLDFADLPVNGCSNYCYYTPQIEVPLITGKDENGHVYLKCDVGSKVSNINYTWYKNGVQIVNQNGLQQLYLQDYGAGEYQCNSSFAGIDLQSKTVNICDEDVHIEGDKAVCVGYDPSLVISYEPKFHPSANLNQVQWQLSPSSAIGTDVTVENGLQGARLDLKFINATPQNEYIIIRATANTDCGLETLEIKVELSTKCVWPGDINDDGAVLFGNSNIPWIDDAVAMNFAIHKLEQYANDNNLTLNSYPRPLGIATKSSDWLPQYATDWELESPNEIVPATFNIEDNDGTVIATLNLKYADANGDGALEETINWNPLTNSFESIQTPTDFDVIAYHGDMESKHYGNSLDSIISNAPNAKISAVGTALTMVEVDSILSASPTDTIRHMATFTLGSLLETVSDVNQIAFVLEATTPTNPNERAYIDISNSYLSQNNFIEYAFKKKGQAGEDLTRWFASLKTDGLIGKDFTGQEVCRLICHMTIVDFAAKTNNPSTRNPVTLKNPITGIVGGNGLSYARSNTLTIGSQTSFLSARVNLQGAYETSTNSMNDKLRVLGLIPSLEPYSALENFSLSHIEGKLVRLLGSMEVLSNKGKASIVDWIFVELRATSSGALILARPALLTRSGQIVDVDGESPIDLSDMPRGNYQFVVRHRNHLPVKTTLSLKNGENLVDFTTQKEHQTALAPQVYGMISGEVRQDDEINEKDLADWQEENGRFHEYLKGDLNMDGQVNGSDLLNEESDKVIQQGQK